MTVKQYKEQHQHINYCEAIIFPDGTIEDAIPSHMYKLISIANEDFEVLKEMMPIEAGPVPWLVDHTNCCSVWYDLGYFPENMTQEQLDTINELIDCGILSNNFQGHKLFEKSICECNRIIARSNDKEEIEKAIQKRDQCFDK